MSHYRTALFRSAIFASCLSFGIGANTFAKQQAVTLMSYNVENLFDSRHDEGREDYTYLPLAEKRRSPEAMEYCNNQQSERYREECLTLDWSEQAFHGKLAKAAQVLKAFDNGKGPDIAVFAEVENENVLKTLVSKHLADAGYQTVIVLEGLDRRGIDVGIISRFPLAGTPKIHVDWQRPFPKLTSRGILEVPLKIAGESVVVFANHWPAPYHDEEERAAAATALRNAMTGLGPEALAIAAGDFNTIEPDYPQSSITKILLQKNGAATIADAVAVCLQRKGQGCTRIPGTQFYPKDFTWSHLDRIFLSGAFKNSERVSVDFEDLEILAPLFALCLRTPKTQDGSRWDIPNQDQVDLCPGQNDGNRKRKVVVPYRFSAETGEGYSDHLPLAFRFSINERE